MPAVTVSVLADTHIRAGGRGLPKAAWDILNRADLILHAGDVVDGDLLDRLSLVAPVHAVLGNNDHALEGVLAPTVEMAIAGVRVGMVHDGGPSAGRAARLQRRFPTAKVVVFGHSHAPLNEWALMGQLLFNPGSAMQRRRQAHHSMGELVLAEGQVVSHQVIWLA